MLRPRLFFTLLICAILLYSCGNNQVQPITSCQTTRECLSIRNSNGSCASVITYLENKNPDKDIHVVVAIDTLINNAWIQQKPDSIIVLRSQSAELGHPSKMIGERCTQVKRWFIRKSCFNNWNCNDNSPNTGLTEDETSHVSCTGDCISSNGIIQNGCLYIGFNSPVFNQDQRATIRELYTHLRAASTQNYILQTNLIHAFLPVLSGTDCDNRSTIIRRTSFESYGNTCQFSISGFPAYTIPGTAETSDNIRIFFPYAITGAITRTLNNTTVDFSNNLDGAVRLEYVLNGIIQRLRGDYITKIEVTRSKLVFSSNLLCVTIDNID